MQIANTSILDYINASGSAFGSMGFSHSPDAPSTDEYSVFWFGSQERIAVIACEYSPTKNKMYLRYIFQYKWGNDWANLH